MTTLAKAQMSFLVSTMSIYQWKELSVVERNTHNYFRPTCKPTFRTTVVKVSQIASLVLMHLLPWAHRKRWIPIRSMGYVHTHQGMLAIEGWGSPSCIWSVVLKNGENNRKVGKTSQAISQAPALGPEHDKIQARWASNVSSKSMLKKVWWCKWSKIESWSWTFCCLMNYSNGGRHARIEGGRRSHAALKCCWKINVLLSIHAKVSRRKGHW
jgi:hypothetical protein